MNEIEFTDITLHVGLWIVAIGMSTLAFFFRSHLKSHERQDIPRRPDETTV